MATVFVETGLMYRADGPDAMKPVGEVEYVNRTSAADADARQGKPRFCAGIVGHADLMLGDRVQPVLEAMAEAGGGRFRGIRYGVCWDDSSVAQFIRHQAPRHLVLDPVFRQGFARLQALGLSFESWQFYPQLPDVVDLLRAFPEANVVLNHAGGVLGVPPQHIDREQVFAIWRKYLQALAQFPNLSVKVGGWGSLINGWDFHLRDMPPTSEELAAAWRPYVETCIETFGPNRCMMESNFPPDKQSCGYGVLWNALKRITRDYTAAEKAALYHDTAARVYRLSR